VGVTTMTTDKEIEQVFQELEINTVAIWNDYKNIWIVEVPEINDIQIETLSKEFESIGYIRPETVNTISITVEV
jgi:predicted Zn-dependent protease